MLLTLLILGTPFFALPALLVLGASRAAADADEWLDGWESRQPRQPAPRPEIYPQARAAVRLRVAPEPQGIAS